MYFTHMPLNPQRRSTREMLASPQRMHAAVLSAFTPGASASGRILWRIDGPQAHQLDLYIVSPVEPSLEAMAEQAGWSTQPFWRSAAYEPFLERLASGQRWVFRLRANPVINVQPTDGGRGHRVPLVTLADQLGWLEQRGRSHGFELAPHEVAREIRPNVRTSEHRTDRFRRGAGAESTHVTLATIAYEGVLVVTDPVELRRALTKGIGPAKGYGCGLMTLAPAP